MGVSSKSCNSKVNFILRCSLKSLKRHLERIGLILLPGEVITLQWSVFISAWKRKGSLNSSGWFVRQLSKMEVPLVAKFTMGTRPYEVERRSRSNRFRSPLQSTTPFGCMSKNVSQRSMTESVRSPSSQLGGWYNPMISIWCPDGSSNSTLSVLKEHSRLTFKTLKFSCTYTEIPPFFRLSGPTQSLSLRYIVYPPIATVLSSFCLQRCVSEILPTSISHDRKSAARATDGRILFLILSRLHMLRNGLLGTENNPVEDDPLPTLANFFQVTPPWHLF